MTLRAVCDDGVCRCCAERGRGQGGKLVQPVCCDTLPSTCTFLSAESCRQTIDWQGLFVSLKVMVLVVVVFLVKIRQLFRFVSFGVNTHEISIFSPTIQSSAQLLR